MLRNLSIGVKTFLAPGILLVLFVALVGFAGLQLTGERESVRRLVDEFITTSDHASVLRQRVTDTQSGVFRLMIFKRLNRPKEDVDAAAEQVATSLGQARTVYENLLAESAPLAGDRPALRERIEALGGPLEDYVGAAKRAAQLAKINPALASTVIISATSGYDALRGELEAINRKTVALAEQEQASIQASLAELNTVGAAVAGLAVVLGLLVTVLVGQHIRGGIVRCNRDLQRLAAGEIDITLPDTDRRDEIGQIAQAMQAFQANQTEIERLRQRQVEQEAEAAETRQRLVWNVADELEHAVRDIITDLNTAADTMARRTAGSQSLVTKASSSATTATANSQNTSQRIQDLVSAVAQLNSSILEVGSRAETAMETTREAVTQAERSDAIVSSLNTSAKRIGDVVDLIRDIAEQTNLLALNATIEAARAGEAGRGFAVVANEVKNLASQTGKATEEISTQIAEMQAATAQAVEAIQAISGIIDQISEGSSVISSAVSEQTATTREVASTIQSIGEEAQAVVSELENVSGFMESTDQNVAAVHQTAKQIDERIGTLDAQVSGFLKQLREA